MPTRSDMAACRDLLRHGSRSFHAASFLLPSTVRDPATALYAFCRIADDIVDGPRPGSAALDGLQARLARIYSGDPLSQPADRAFARVVDEFAIPRALPAALLEGFAWDAAGRTYETLDDLQDYGARVAGSVGAMMALVMGQRDPGVLARACELGVAMQLTNIARDVGEDAAAGRLYLPRRWLREGGLDPDAWLRAPSINPVVADAVARLLEAAAVLYERASSGIDRLPLTCRFGIHAASRLYAGIGSQVAQQRFDSVSRRARVSGQRKAVLALAAMGAALRSPRAMPADALPAIRFLVMAVTASNSVVGERIAPWRLGRRWIKVLEMLAAQQSRERPDVQAG